MKEHVPPYNGSRPLMGDRQTFNVFALNDHQGGNQSIQIPDMGENKTHRAYVQNLQPSMTYVFYVSAQNNHGFSISDIISCISSKGKCLI